MKPAMPWFAQLLEDIRSLKIQGAQRVARAGVEGLARLSREKGGAELKQAAGALIATRPTEPMLRNAIAYFLAHANGRNSEAVLARILASFDEGERRIAAAAAGLIKDGGTYFTHCHSSTVIAAFRHARAQGKRFTVHNTETRPLFQGRTTARELAALGIPVEHFVDSAARVALKGCDAVFLGADAILADGRIANKIGSEMIAELAHRRHVRVYVLAHSWKYDPATARGFREVIEERPAGEVWADAPGGVRVENPAFEFIDPRLVRAVIFEQGLRDPRTAAREMEVRRAWLLTTEKMH